MNDTIKGLLANLEIAELNEMQKAFLAANESDSGLLLLSPTGSGKTLAFLLPLFLGLHKNTTGIQALIIVPSRELALQIEKVWKAMNTGFKVNCFYGGHDMTTEINNLIQPPALLIGTPGRLAEHLRKEQFNTGHIKTLVLDEFDKSLEFGFETDMEFIISKLGSLNKRMLTSATQSLELPSFLGIEGDVTELNFLQNESVEGLDIHLVKADQIDKADTLFRLLCAIGHEHTLVFCNHRDTVHQISNLLYKKGLVHDIYHGKLEQYERELSLARFRNGSNNILISTDLASRGLDIADMKNVVHYHLPATETIFTHRNGRTARMDNKGDAYLIINEDEYVPEFIDKATPWMDLPTAPPMPPNPRWTTIHITGGKKQKINKVDIVGLFLKKGELAKDELGIIEVGDFHSYAAILKEKATKMIAKLGMEKIKGYRIKLEIAS